MAHRDSSRAEIVDRAVQLASVCGLEGLSIGQLAAAVSMSKGGIGAHFRTKTELQMAAIHRAAEMYRDVLITPTLTVEPGLPQIEAFIKNWFSYIDRGTFDGGCFFTNALLELDDLDDDAVVQEVRNVYSSFLQWVAGLAKKAIELRHFRKDADPELFAFEAEGILVSYIVGRGIGTENKSRKLAKKATASLIERFAA